MIRGERFELDLGSDDEDTSARQSAPLPASFVGDILERKPAAPKPPSAPALKSKTGFPEHRKRPAQSRFKSRNAASPKTQTTEQPGSSVLANKPASASDKISSDHASGKAKSWEEEEKERIDQENRQKLADMSPMEIEEERRELMNSLSPAFLQRLLQRSNVESGSEEVDLSQALETVHRSEQKPKTQSTKQVTFEEPKEGPAEEAQELSSREVEKEGDSSENHLPHDSVHFPRPPQPPSLDPSSETFFEDLHQKYFPSLPSDPDKLEWMQSTTPNRASYDPAASAFNAGEIRFNFKGELIPPKTASEIPVTAGLHHHGDAPDAAGYTVAELAHLSRSSYAAQRCIAFQTLGRILYRLSKGEFGDAGEPDDPENAAEDSFGELARGLWREVERLQVITNLIDESEGRGVDGGKHLSAKTYATEAVWLWRKGGGRRWKAA